jgi:hypothetical protein
MTLGRKTKTYRFEDIGANSHETRGETLFRRGCRDENAGKAGLAETPKRQRLFDELFSPAHADQR